MFANNTSAANSCNASLTHFQYEPPSAFDVFTGVLMILIIITSLAGNILIFYAFLTNAKLRVVNNYFIMNLTVSDILTASLVIPFDVNTKLYGLSSWTYGPVMCKVWTNLYIISVPTSILTLCVVSIDRYQAISNPLGYRAGVTLNKAKAFILIAGIWTLTLFMAFLPVVTGPPLNVTLSRDLPPDCPDVYFCYFDLSPTYSAAITIIAFILPSVVMAILYARMYVIITFERYIAGECGNGSTERRNDGRNLERNSQKEINRNREITAARKGSGEKEKVKNEAFNMNECRRDEEHAHTSNNMKSNRNDNHETGRKSDKQRSACDRHNINCSHNKNKHSTTHESHHSISSQRSQHATASQAKVAKHFSVIVLVQLVCWYPFSVQSLVYNWCNDCTHMSSSARYFLLTIGYMSCATNPYLYAYQQRSFRQVFKRMLGIRR